MTVQRCLAVASIALTLFLAGCRNGGDGDDVGGGIVNSGWVRITYPTEDPTYVTPYDSIYLKGRAFVSPGWYTCCPPNPAVTVTWLNAATSTSGQATSNAYLSDPFFRVIVHEWSASINLALGANSITLTATDPGGNMGTDSITVTYQP